MFGRDFVAFVPGSIERHCRQGHVGASRFVASRTDALLGCAQSSGRNPGEQQLNVSE
jgi:hypothetical protein